MCTMCVSDFLRHVIMGHTCPPFYFIMKPTLYQVISTYEPGTNKVIRYLLVPPIVQMKGQIKIDNGRKIITIGNDGVTCLF